LPKTPRRSVSPPPYAKPPSIRQHSRITLNRTPKGRRNVAAQPDDAQMNA
jgi:hypothetical protein